MIRPRVYLTRPELECVLHVSRQFERDGAASPIGAAIQFLIGWGIVAVNVHKSLDEEARAAAAEALAGWVKGQESVH